MVITKPLYDRVNFLVMNFKERFESALGEKNLTKTAFAEELGLENEQNITHWISRGGISKKWQFKACQILGVNTEWLQTGNGQRYPSIVLQIDSIKHNQAIDNVVLAVREPLPDESVELTMNEQSSHYSHIQLPGNIISIPQHNEVMASLGDGAASVDAQSQITNWQVTVGWVNDNVPANTGKHNLRIVTGDGDSMPGYFNGGDPILIDVGVTTLTSDGLYFFQYEGDNYVKRLQKIPDGILVVSSNPHVKDWIITPDKQFQIFGRALKAWESKVFV